jgi:hypothetical protein
MHSLLKYTDDLALNIVLSNELHVIIIDLVALIKADVDIIEATKNCADCHVFLLGWLDDISYLVLIQQNYLSYVA